MPLPANLKLNRNHIAIAWTFLYPMLQKRAAASAPLWDDRLVDISNRLLTNDAFLTLLEQVFNREKPVQALELETPPGVSREDARAFAGNYQFVEGWLRDTASSLEAAPYVKTEQPCDIADSATTLHHISSSKMAGHDVEPNASQYVMAKQAEMSSAMVANEPVGSATGSSAVRPPDKWVGQNVAPSPAQQMPVGQAAHGYAGAPAAAFTPTQPIGLAQAQAEAMHLPESMTGTQVVGASLSPLAGSAPVQSTPTPQYQPTDMMPDTVSVNQPSTAKNMAEAAVLAGTPTPYSEGTQPYQPPESSQRGPATPIAAQQTPPYSVPAQTGVGTPAGLTTSSGSTPSAAASTPSAAQTASSGNVSQGAQGSVPPSSATPQGTPPSAMQSPAESKQADKK